MKLLFCCERYYPSVGGVQVVMQKIAEQLIARGHEVIVATSYTPERTSLVHNGVQIKDFKISGNRSRGFNGDLKPYIDYVLNFQGDAILVKAAQQWTFDALWDVASEIKIRKIFIPCGFSGLSDSNYAKYFEDLPSVLFKWDHLILYSDTYQDIEFIRNTGYENITVLSNGACDLEFSAAVDPNFSNELKIKSEDIVLLSVATLSPMKGQLELAESFRDLNTNGRRIVLIINAKDPENLVEMKGLETEQSKVFKLLHNFFHRIFSQWRRWLLVVRLGYENFRINGYQATARKAWTFINRLTHQHSRSYKEDLEHCIDQVHQDINKRVILTDLSRKELVQAYLRADLFIFTSKIECSPLVLFESAAGGTEFLSTKVGNAEEIATWTRAGSILHGCVVKNGVTTFENGDLTKAIEALISQPISLRERGLTARQRWKQHFTWRQIATHYEEILANKRCTVGNFR